MSLNPAKRLRCVARGVVVVWTLCSVQFAGCARLDQALSPKPAPPIDTNSVVERITALTKRWETEPIPVSLERQVFYDDAVVASRSGSIQRLQGHPKRINEGKPLLVQDTWWESRFGNWGIGIYFSILTNAQGRYRCWYQYGKNNEVGYAESEDGYSWKKPILNLSLDNRVMYPAHGPCVMEDFHDKRRSHRFKMIYGGKNRETGTYRAVMFAHSPDGLSWSAQDDVVWMDEEGTDTGNSIMWDEAIGMYRIFVRPGYADRRSRQLVRSAVDSGDLALLRKALFMAGPNEPWVRVGDLAAPWGQLYSLFCQKYGSIYISYIQMFTQGSFEGRGIATDDRLDADVNDFYIATSRDGLNWDMTWIEAKQPFLERGPAGSFDQNGVWPPSSPLLNVGDVHRIYYCGRWPRHTRYTPGMMMDGKRLDPPKPRSAIGASEIRMDGLIYRESVGDGNSLTTKSFVLEGERIEVNCDASHGSLEVEVLAKDGSPMDGFGQDRADAIQEDSCHRLVAWGGNSSMAQIKGREIKLRFIMRGTVRLYAFQVLGTESRP